MKGETMQGQQMVECSYCHDPATDYDVLFQPWCHACRMRKWLINWVAVRHWLPQELADRGKTEASAKAAWISFVTNALEYEVAEVWLRLALLARRAEYAYLGSGRTTRYLLPPDQDTPYSDTLFRNPWEAQWACFFNALHLPFRYLRGTHYEPADLPASTAFWLETLSCSSLNKGEDDQLSSLHVFSLQGAYAIITSPQSARSEPERRIQARQFVQRTGKAVCILEGCIGLPSHWDGSTICLLTRELEAIWPLHWGECLSCGAIGCFNRLFPALRFCQCQENQYRENTPRLVKAYLAARYAHFEEALPPQLSAPVLEV